jgi:hypothetical protein
MMPCCGGFDCVKLIGMDNGCAEILLPKAMWMNGLRRKDVERFDFDSNKSVLRNPDFSGLYQGSIVVYPSFYIPDNYLTFCCSSIRTNRLQIKDVSVDMAI